MLSTLEVLEPANNKCSKQQMQYLNCGWMAMDAIWALIFRLPATSWTNAASMACSDQLILMKMGKIGATRSQAQLGKLTVLLHPIAVAHF